jgi:hypothetical protein
MEGSRRVYNNHDDNTTNNNNNNNKGVCHTVALPFALRSILRQKKNYGNSNLFHHAKI